MKLIEGIVYTKEIENLSDALEAMGLIVHDGHRTVSNGIVRGIAYLYNLVTRVKIRTVISDEMVGTFMETLHCFGDCRIQVFAADACLA